MRRRILPALVAACFVLGAASPDPRVDALRLAITRVHGAISPACSAGIEAARGLPPAERWAAHQAVSWPGIEGTRGSLYDAVHDRLERLGLESECGAPPEIHPGGELVHPDGGFALPLPAGFEVVVGHEWLLARSPEGDRALEVRSYPSVYSTRALAELEKSWLERQRRIEVEVKGLSDAPRDPGEPPGKWDREAHALELEFRAGGRELPTRVTWVRVQGRVVRLVAVRELAAAWRNLGELERAVRGVRPIPVS